MIRTLLAIFFSLAITLTMSSLNVWAHEGHEHPEEGKEKTVINLIGNVVGEESNKVKILCPVTKDWFVLDEKTPRAAYKDKTYYFCCPGCKPQFEKNSEKYVSEMSKKEDAKKE